MKKHSIFSWILIFTTIIYSTAINAQNTMVEIANRVNTAVTYSCANHIKGKLFVVGGEHVICEGNSIVTVYVLTGGEEDCINTAILVAKDLNKLASCSVIVPSREAARKTIKLMEQFNSKGVSLIIYNLKLDEIEWKEDKLAV